jgi:hypothetical protein
MAEQDPDDGSADGDDEFLYQNGTTTCQLPGGTPSTSINNSACSRPCTERHEAVHFSDITPCCAGAGRAYDAAATPGDKAAVRSGFFAWMNANRDWFECRAYAESVRCADELLARNNCDSQSSVCCNTLTAYKTAMSANQTSSCAAAGPALSACPY